MRKEKELFINRLDRLGKGERSALRRAAGIMLQDADGSALVAFYKCVPFKVEKWQEPRWFAVACLSCLWDSSSIEGKPLEHIIKEMVRTEILSASTTHRVEILLDTKWDEDGYMLTKLVRIIRLIRQKADSGQPDFISLLDDLLFWNSETQSVQRKWARTIFANIGKE